MSCPHCAPGDTPALDHPTVVLIGNPNVGKSSFFNCATRASQDVRNAPGTTVEMHEGTWPEAGVRLVDLPGTYSLLARSPDEQVTTDMLAGRLGTTPDLAVVLLDATALPRSLYLLGQVAQTGTPAVAVLTMTDVAHSRDAAVDAHRLAGILGVPVVALDPREGTGSLAAVVSRGLTHPPRVRGITPDPEAPGHPDDEAVPRVTAQLARSETLFAWVEDVRSALGLTSEQAVRTLSDRIDSVLLHPWLGAPLFAAVVWLLFQLATTAAAPLMEWAGAVVTGPVAGAASAALGWMGLAGTAIEGLVVDGVIAGVGTVVAFAPLMALMFLALAALDESGYLARAAFLADRAMRAIGLDGRAILPLIVGYGCNLPALAAVRVLPDARQRTIAAILIPYTSCAARLTVYVMLAAAFFPRHAGSVIFLMYVLSAALVVLAGLALTRGRGVAAAPLVMVLPAYQLPRIRPLLTLTWQRTKGFLVGAGRMIVVILTAMWLLMAIPATGEHPIGAVPVRDSLYGTTAEAIAPVFAPAGFDSWQASAALITGFVAKEVVVGSFAQSFAVEESAAQPADLGSRLRETFGESSGGHGGAAALAFMVFVLAYTPCVATLAEQRRVLGWRTTLAASGVQLVVAWVLAVAVFQAMKVVL